MKLKTYLSRKKITQQDFAERLKVQQQSVSRYCAGDMPKRQVAFRIIKLTKGAVTLEDLWNVKIK